MEGREAQVVVINADDSQTSFTFDALVENEDGDYISSKVQYVNNDILTDCVLTKDYKELRISCGNMRWVLWSEKQRVYPGGKFWAEAEDGTEATACVEIDQLDGDGGNEDDVAVSTLIVDSSPNADSLFEPRTQHDDKGNSLGKISYKFNGEMCTAHCLPYGRVQAESGQVFERVDSWLLSLKRSQVSIQ